MGIVSALSPHMNSLLATALRVFVGLSGVGHSASGGDDGDIGFARVARTLGLKSGRDAAGPFGRLYHARSCRRRRWSRSC